MDTNYLHNCNTAAVNLEPKDLLIKVGLTMKPGPAFTHPRKDFLLVGCWSLPRKTFGLP